VRSALESVDGVESVEVDFSAGTATVVTNGEVSEEAMIEALEAAEYGGSVQR
jgi:copper chaperone CopZ